MIEKDKIIELIKKYQAESEPWNATGYYISKADVVDDLEELLKSMKGSKTK